MRCDSPDANAQIGHIARITQKGQIAHITRKGQILANLTPKEISLEWGISPKTMRKFLRDTIRTNGGESPGKGGKWAIPPESLESLKVLFDAWNARKGAKTIEVLITPDMLESDISPDSE